MFHDGGYLGGMHGEWWILWLLVIGIALFYVWQRPSRRGDAPEYELPDDPHEVLRGRLARGERSLRSSMKNPRPCSTATTDVTFAC